MHSIWPLYSIGPGSHSHHTALPKEQKGKKTQPLIRCQYPPSSLQKKNPETYILYFFSRHAKPRLSVCVFSSKLQSSTGVEITSSRDTEGKGSFSWGSLLLNFQTGSICRIQHFICHSPGKLLQHNWAGLIECSSKWPFKSLFFYP